ncbi:MAG: exodeoxyribonuclease VII large subunit [FCB group bacterium]|nr:exodeoxyribonuclease VII large subunit [FCB group bacterium]
MLPKPKAYTVSAITRMIKGTLEDSFNNIWIEGEISNYILHSSGHRYFNLKDDKAVIKVIIWRSVGYSLKFEPENGQKVVAYGDITVYEKGGNYQLNCHKLVPMGMGELEIAYRQLYEKLAEEGLFDESKKKPIPAFAQKIGVVTSPTGAAIRDIIQISRRRNNSVELIIYPALVQGEKAEKSIVAGIEYFNSRKDIDIIITGRGGGSLEDLWCFNTEEVVRAIASSKIPVISSVGHEIDITLSDLAADLRAPTPSAAAELAVWSKREFEEQIDTHIAIQTNHLKNIVETARQNLTALLKRPIFRRPFDMVRQQQQNLDNLTRNLLKAGKNSFDNFKNKLSLSLSKLDALSPLKILLRGYSVSRNYPESTLVRSINDIHPGEKLETILPDGRVFSLVEKLKKDKLL